MAVSSGEQISVSLARLREGGAVGGPRVGEGRQGKGFWREGPLEGVASGGRAGGGVSGGRARGPDPQGDLKKSSGSRGRRRSAGRRRASRAQPSAAVRLPEQAGGSGRPGWGRRLTVPALPHTCCGSGRAHRARPGVPGGAEGRARWPVRARCAEPNPGQAG